MWLYKFLVCVLYDLFDFTFGRLLFPVPLSGEIVGCVLCAAMFGWEGLWYGLEAIDPTEQLDAFIPTATIIAFRNKDKH